MFGFTKKSAQSANGSTIPYTDALPIIAKDYLYPKLKQHGYTRSGLTFYKQYADDIQAIINLQANPYNNASESTFYVNIGLYHPVMCNLVYGSAVPDCPKEYNASARWRINDISKKAKASYSYKPSSDIDAVASQAIDDVITYVVPFLEAHHNLDDLLQGDVGYNKPSPVYFMSAAVHKYLKNDKSYAKDLQDGYDYCIKKDLPALAHQMVGLAQILGITLPAKELKGLTEYTYTFTIKKKLTPIGDERKSINSLSSRLATLEYTDKIGYMTGWNPQLTAYQQQFRFYTRQPELFETKIQSRLEKLKIKPEIKKRVI